MTTKRLLSAATVFFVVIFTLPPIILVLVPSIRGSPNERAVWILVWITGVLAASREMAKRAKVENP